jgi:predicted dehydrogenase
MSNDKEPITASEDDCSLSSSGDQSTFNAPQLAYQPRDPQSYRPHIGLVGCGGITATHLRAYQNAGYQVVALCDRIEENARKRQQEFFPEAELYTDVRQLLRRDDVEVVDIATHPPERVPLIEAALKARKHVLSQKPFVLDLDTGERLADLADAQGVKLAVNQNGRWAPHFSYIREATCAGLIGDVMSLHARVSWDHTWIMGTPFETIDDVILYDFAIHWFDFASNLLQNKKITSVQASRSRAAGQTAKPPMLAQVMFQFEGGQGSLLFDANVPFGSEDHTYIGGTVGTLHSSGPDLGNQTVTLFTAQGKAMPQLAGNWFPDGFHGTMAELLCAVEENREPRNSGRENLHSLAFCFAAIAAAHEGVAKVPGEVRSLPKGSVPAAMSGSR